MPSLIQLHCNVEICQRRHYGLGYCRAHYKRVKTGQSLDDPIVGRRIYLQGDSCIIPGCGGFPRRLDLCLSHAYIRNTMKLSDEKIISLFTNPVCWICGRQEWAKGKSNLSLDHEHSHHPENRKAGCDECVRGLLCHSCNVGLGNFLDNPDLLQKASDYLENWSKALQSRP